MTKTMNNPLLISGILLVALAVFFLWFVWWKSKARGLSGAQKEEVWNHWHSVLAIGDPHRRLMEADKVVDHAMKLLGYQGSFADKLRKAGPCFSDVQSLWDAHKLRNRLAHEVNVSLSEKDVQRAVNTFEKALRNLC